MCNYQYDSKLAKENPKYYFYCNNKNKMVDYEDCRKCKYFKYNEEKLKIEQD